MRILTIMTMVSALALGACQDSGGSDAGGDHAHGEEAIRRTVWTDSLELFAEYSPPVAGESAAFLVHVTRLDDFSPPASGSVTLVLTGEDGGKISFPSAEPQRDGIWEIEATIPEAGAYEAALVPGGGIPGRAAYFGVVDVYATGEEAEAEHAHEVAIAEAHGHEGGAVETGHAHEHASAAEEVHAHEDAATEAHAHEHEGAIAEAHEHEGALEGEHDHASPVEGQVHAAHTESGAHGGHAEDAHGEHEHAEKADAEDARGEDAPLAGEILEGTEVVFLKEQQWNTDFMVERAAVSSMQAGVATVASVAPYRRGYAEIVSPVEGLIDVARNRDMVTEGNRVDRGGYLLTISPPPGGEGSWTERRQAYLRAEREYERAKRLLESDAIARRDYEAIEKEYIIEKTGFETILGGCGATPVEDETSGEVHLRLQAPISGVVASMAVSPGRRVGAGQTLVTLVDPARVWLEADLFERDYYRATDPVGVEIRVPGLEEPLTVTGEDFRVVSAGEVFDRKSRTIPMIFEIENPGGRLKIGQVVQTRILTGHAGEYLAVPASAVIDEDYTKYVFVQTGGESFVRREIETGPESAGLVSVTSGLRPGERVVTRGAYMLRLAASSVGVADPHVH